MKSFAALLLLIAPISLPATLSAPTTEVTPTYQVVPDQTTLKILSPELQNQKIGKLVLSNGMKVYLVSDPGALQSAAGLAVEAGSWQDPKTYPGLAHFLEHMLFMGTKAYPIEDEYMKYISDHGGMVNAYTASDRTVYMLSVNNDAFADAIDRFSHFFIDPLFSPSCIARELHAVDQEHSKNIEHDGWRQYMILKETSNKDHPNNSFSTGNAKTLGGIPQEALKQWYSTHYTAQGMHLVFVSPLPLEEMVALASEKFSRVPSFPKAASTINTSMLSSSQKGHMIFIKPVKDLRTLSLVWEVPSQFASDIERKAPELVAYVLGEEGKGSLISLLKQENIAEGIHVSCDRFDRNSLLFGIDITLTEQGVHQLDRAISCTYEMIDLLKEKGFPEKIYEEIKTLSEIRYQYQSRQDPFKSVISLTEDLVYEDLATYPQKTQIPSKFDPAFIQAFLTTLTPKDCLYFVQASPRQTGVLPDVKEKWMDAEYAIKEISPDRLMAWEQIIPEQGLSLPAQNPYLPKDLTLVSLPANAATQEMPRLLSEDAGSKVYFAQDTRYKLPEMAACFSIKTPLLDQTAKADVLSDLYLKALTEKLSETLHYAHAANLNVQFGKEPFALSFVFQGFSDPLPVLLTEIFQELKEVIPTKEQFAIYKTALTSDYSNRSKELPVNQALDVLSHVLDKTPTDKEKLSAIQKITYEDFLTFSKELFAKAYIESVLYGNLSEADAETLWLGLKNTLSAAPYPVKEQTQPKILVLDEKYGPYMIKESSERQGNGVVLLLEEGDFSFEKRAVQQILGSALKEGFFNALRTKQQTAYIAKAWNTEQERQLLQYFAVQSSTHHPSELLPRFELFIEDFHKNFEEQISFERFESIRDNLVTLLEKPPENMYTMALRLSDLAFNYEDFSWIKSRILHLQNLSYESFCTQAKAFLSRENGKRLAVLVEGVVPKETDFRYEQISKEDIHNLGAFVSVK